MACDAIPLSYLRKGPEAALSAEVAADPMQ